MACDIADLRCNIKHEHNSTPCAQVRKKHVVSPDFKWISDGALPEGAVKRPNNICCHCVSLIKNINQNSKEHGPYRAHALNMSSNSKQQTPACPAAALP